MPTTVKQADYMRSLVAELVEKLYATEDTMKATKSLDIDTIVEELTRVSKDLVVSTVSESISREYLD